MARRFTGSQSQESFRKAYFKHFKQSPGKNDLRIANKCCYVMRLTLKLTFNLQFCTGFYYTADLAHRDAAGDYKLIGRKGDAIKTHGTWLSVAEIESVMVSR